MQDDQRTMGEGERRGEATRLADLLPPSLPSTALPLSGLTEAEEAKARAAHIRRFIKAGWKWGNGLLTKGRVSRPAGLDYHAVVPLPWAPQYNPVTDATAVRIMGAVFIGPRRYQHRDTGLIMDENGMFRDPDECQECGGMGFVLTRMGLGPNVPRYRYNKAYCRSCLTPDEVAALREDVPAPARGGRR